MKKPDDCGYASSSRALSLVSKEIGLCGALLWLTLNFCANSMLVLLILRCVDYFYNRKKRKLENRLKLKKALS